jgi:hypothetical protein
MRIYGIYENALLLLQVCEAEVILEKERETTSTESFNR